MIKNITVLFFILIQSCNHRIDLKDGLIFKIQIQPLHTYNQVITSKSHNELKYICSEDILNKLKAKGIANPTISDNDYEMSVVLKSEKVNSSNKFPLIVEFTKYKSNDKKMSSKIEGTKGYGFASLDGSMTFDSISSSISSEEFKKSMIATMNNILSALKFPERKMKVGEQFTQETPLKNSMQGLNFDMKIISTYKLNNFTNDFAYFDISSEYIFDTGSTSTMQNFEGIGTEKGKLTYDIRNNYFTYYETTQEIDLTMKLELYSLNVKTKSNTIQKTIIREN